MTLALLATLGAIVIGFVLLPIFSSSGTRHRALVGEERERVDLTEKKAQLLDAIQDLDFEKASGKLSDADYESARNEYLAEVAVVMERLDAITPKKPTKRKAKGAKAKKTAGGGSEAAVACGACGTDNAGGAKFCMECGEPLARACAACGEPASAKAKFCSGCGESLAEVSA